MVDPLVVPALEVDEAEDLVRTNRLSFVQLDGGLALTHFIYNKT
jgi:hypothetical protein